MDILPEEDALNVQLIQELWQQRDKLNHRREGRLLNSGIHREALTQQQSPSTIDQEMDKMLSQLRSLKLTKTELTAAAQSMPFLNQIQIDPRKHTTLLNQAAVQSPAQGYSSAPGYKNWQNSTRPPQDCRPPQGSQYSQDSQYPQGPQHPQDSTAFGRPQQDAQGQQGTRGQGQRTYFGCGGSHRFTKHKYQGLKDLIQQGFMHLSNKERLVAGTHNQPRPVLPQLSNKGQLKGIKDQLRTYQGTDLDRPKEEQTQQQAPIGRTDFTTFHDRVVLKSSNKIHTNWEDYYQVRPTDSVTPSQQHPQTHPTLRDSSTARTAALPQEKNVQPGECIQIISQPADKTAEARKKNKSSNPQRRSQRQTLNQVSH